MKAEYRQATTEEPASGDDGDDSLDNGDEEKSDLRPGFHDI